MRVELDLRIYDEQGDCQARQSILFVSDAVTPVPDVGDKITAIAFEDEFQGTVYARHFDFSKVDEKNPSGELRIIVNAREVS